MEWYTALLSHELSNRLGAAETAVRLIIESGGDVPDDRRERIHELILKSIQSGLETAEGVRAIFSAQSGEGTAGSRRMLPLGSVVRDAIHQMRIPASERGIDLHLVESGSEEPIDSERFALAFFNVVSNAIQHHDRPGGKGRVVVDVTRDPEAWSVTVSDDGPGIPAELVGCILESVVQHPSGNGSGLGLAIAAEAVEKMGGTISVEKNAERGMAFRFTMPHLAASPALHTAER
jgi:signal transduction histidine kinase